MHVSPAQIYRAIPKFRPEPRLPRFLEVERWKWHWVSLVNLAYFLFDYSIFWCSVINRVCFRAANEQYELAFRLQPAGPRIIKAFTDFCTINHQDERAMKILRESLASFSQKPEDVRWITLRLALLCYRNRLWNECVNSIRLVLRQNPDDRYFLSLSPYFIVRVFTAKSLFVDWCKSFWRML